MLSAGTMLIMKLDALPSKFRFSTRLHLTKCLTGRSLCNILFFAIFVWSLQLSVLFLCWGATVFWSGLLIDLNLDEVAADKFAPNLCQILTSPQIPAFRVTLAAVHSGMLIWWGRCHPMIETGQQIMSCHVMVSDGTCQIYQWSRSPLV